MMEPKKTTQADLAGSTTTRFLLALVVILSVLFVALEWTTGGSDEPADLDMPDELTQDLDMVPAMEQQKELAPAAPATTVKEAVNEKTREAETQIKVEAVDRTVAAAEAEGQGTAPASDGQTQKQADETQALQPVAVDENADKLKLRVVEELPQFPGGPVEMMKWLTRTLVYPPAARAKQIEGEVLVSFIVNKDGSLSDQRVARSADPLLDAEALRAIRRMPRWKPGTEQGRPARAMIAIPIVFKL